jgi:hypothetical protein
MMRFNICLLMVLALLSCNKDKGSGQEQAAQEQSVEVLPITKGEYENEDHTGTLSIIEIKDTDLQFSISVVTENANCTGEISGIARRDGNDWTYSDNESGCALRFSSSKDAITVTETGACDHGAACSFAAVYRKKDTDEAVSVPPAKLDDIMDFYMALDDTYFNCELSEKYSREERTKSIVYQNVTNGYLIFKSQELDSVQLALYKNRVNNKSYLAYVYQCGAGCQCNRTEFLSYEDGEWKNVYDEVFPDLGSLIKDDVVIGLRLPEKGTTITLYDYENPAKRLGELQWNGTKFNLTME